VQLNNTLTIVLLAAIAGCAVSHPPSDDIPASLRVSGAVLVRETRGVGVQIYRCGVDKADPSRFAWTLKAPEADLFDRAGDKLGKHYAGPSWEAKDGSKVTGEVLARAESPDPTAVPWLLLSAKATSGVGRFADVRFIQRLHTSGGVAPSVGCNQGAVDSEVRVSYTADYWFYADKH
jgi:hypothetical protein